MAGRWDYGRVMAISAGTIFAMAIFVTAIGREKRGDEFGVKEDYAAQASATVG
jgi:hypothetical protein